MFFNPHSKLINPTIYPSATSPTAPFFLAGTDVRAPGHVNMNAHTVSGVALTEPFYMIVKFPSYLQVLDPQLVATDNFCPPSVFEYCMSVPEINYFMVKAISTPALFQPLITNPPSISLVDTFFYSNIIEAGRFTGII